MNILFKKRLLGLLLLLSLDDRVKCFFCNSEFSVAHGGRSDMIISSPIDTKTGCLLLQNEQLFLRLLVLERLLVSYLIEKKIPKHIPMGAKTIYNYKTLEKTDIDAVNKEPI